jgi:signal transduction histidine kinase
MSGRIFAILLCGIIGSTVLTWWLSAGERQRTLTQFRDTNAIDRAEQLVLSVDALPAASRESFLRTLPRIGLRANVNKRLNARKIANSGYAVSLSERLGSSFKVFSLELDPDTCPKPPFERYVNRPSCELIGVELHDGSNLRLQVFGPRNPTPPPVRPDFLFDLLLFLISIAVLALIISRMTMRPLKILAQAATDLGQDINRPALKEQGASEILQATRAFNAMQSRIQQHIQQRTHMLAAITHDLQTPLTRLRLRLEKVGDTELREKLIGDLSTMQMMVKEGLDLARSMDSNEAFQPLDLSSLLDSVCVDASDAGQDVSYERQAGFTVMARPQSLRRALNNLIDNAVKYGHFAKLRMEKNKDPSTPNKHEVCIYIRDGGSGIPADQLTKVFEPFYRLETSRSRDTGGTGLGLTIAQHIAQQHGGHLQLNNLPQGGLEICFCLPLK